MRTLPPPPVPQALREMLKDYPELIEELQKRLIELTLKHAKSIPMFEQAVWLLEDTLSAFYSDASEELKAAQQSGNLEVIKRAQEKEEQVDRARRQSYWSSDDAFGVYFKTYKGAFE